MQILRCFESKPIPQSALAAFATVDCGRRNDSDYQQGFESAVNGVKVDLLTKSERWILGYEGGLRRLMTVTPFL